ncbi:MAG: TonB-dependent receptor [Acidobacteria bacterium]|nr:TonB-dependent receptor [Acidobacteriota bacterium]
MTRVSTCVLVALAIVGAALPAAAQVTVSTGAINGVVADNTKAVLPGVNVTIQSPQMMGTREAVTDAQGRYQFAAVPPGEYKVTFALTGFATLIREGIRVGMAFTATVNVELQLATQQETITVAGESPVVDTQATKISNNFDLETMQNLPTARDFPSLMAETPGVTMTRIDVGGSAAMNETGFRVYGMSDGGNQLTIEGIQVDSFYYNDFGSFQEVQITTGAHTAEMGTPGVMSNMIAKSGGNSYHGSFYADLEKKEWGTRNIDARQLAMGVTGGFDLDARDTNRVDDYKDINGDLGGYIIKDKLWWFGSLRYNASNVSFVNFPVKPQYTRVTSRNTKWTYNLTPNNKLIGYYNYNFKYQPERFVNKQHIHYSLDETRDEDFPVGSWKAEYNSVLSQSMFLEARVGDFFYDFYNFDRAPNKVLYFDTATQERFGGMVADLRHLRRPQFNGSLSYFKSGWGESHNFRVGWEIAQFQQQFDGYGRVGRDKNPNPPQNIEYRLNNGRPSEVYFNETPSTSNIYQWTYSAYVNDAFQLNSRLSFNLGLRLDRYRSGSPAQAHEVTRYDPATQGFVTTSDHFAPIDDAYHFTSVGPRAGVVWDLSGNGKTVMKANYGSYPWRPSGRGVAGQNPNPDTWFTRYVWTDRNGDRIWQPGEEGRLLQVSGGITNQIIDPNWKQNVTTELATWLERELVPNFGLRTGVIWRGDKYKQVTLNPNRPYSAYNVARSVRDPGPDGVAGTADDGSLLTVFDLDPAFVNTPLVNMTTHNPNIDGDDHYTWEIAGMRRMSNNWSMNASFAHTWSREAPNSTNPTPNHFIGTESDRRKHYTNWQGKLAGTVRLPHDLNISPVLRHQSGDPFGRTIQVRLATAGTTETILVEPESTRRVSNITLLDIRAEKGFRFAGRRVSAFVDVFNIANSNAEQDIVQSSGATFLRPIVIIGPRVARIGAKFEW